MVNSLKPEYKGKIKFILANLDSREGRWFADYYDADKVTLIFFKPDGKKISSLIGVQEADFLRNVFDKVFNIE